MGFVEFFTEMSWIVILLLGLAVLFGVAEALMPGFGVCGVISGLCSIGALVVEGVFTKSIFAVLFVFVIVLILILGLFALFVFSARKGHLKKTPIIEGKSAIPENFSDKKEKQLLIGRVGVVVSECKPVGKVAFDGVEKTVIAKSRNVTVGKLVVVEEVRDNFIFVKELKGDKNE